MSQQITKLTWEKLLKIPALLVRGIRHHATGRLYLPRPKKFSLMVTERCDARCVMCSYWRNKPGREPSLAEIGKIFSNPLLTKLETVVLTGGEPTLRSDLPQIADIILSALPRIKSLVIITNALNPALLVRYIEAIMRLKQYRKIKEFIVVISLDALDRVHDDLRGVPGASDQVRASIDLLRKMQRQTPFKIALNCTVQQANIASLLALYKFSKTVGLPVYFRPITLKIAAQDIFDQQQALGPKQLKELTQLFNGPIELNLMDQLFWQDCFRIKSGSRRRLPCAVPYQVVFMKAQGDIYACGMHDQVAPLLYGNIYEQSIDRIWSSPQAKATRQKLIRDHCPRCDSPCEISFSLNTEVFYLVRQLLRRKLRGLIQ